MHRAAAADVPGRIRKRDAYAVGIARGDAVGQPRRQVRFVRDDRRFARGDHHRHGYIPALAEDHVRLALPDQAARLAHAAQNAERVRKVLPGEIAPELARGDGVIRHARHRGDQLALHAAFRARIIHLPALRQQPPHQSKVRRDVPGRAAAREQNPHGFLSSLRTRVSHPYYTAFGAFVTPVFLPVPSRRPPRRRRRRSPSPQKTILRGCS